MASKKRGGLSKREAAAKKAGVKVDYSKSAKSQGSSKSSSSKSSSSSNKVWVAAEKGNLVNGKAPAGQFPVKDVAGYWADSSPSNSKITSYDQGGAVYGDSDYSDSLKKSSSSKSSNNKSSSSKDSSKSSSSSNRSTASDYLRGALGINTANAAGNASPSGKVARPTGSTNWLGNTLGVIGNAATGPVGAVYRGVTGKSLDLGLSEGLGLNKYLRNDAMEFPVGEGTADIGTGTNINGNLYPFASDEAFAESQGVGSERASEYANAERERRGAKSQEDQLRNQFGLGEPSIDYGEVAGAYDENYDDSNSIAGRFNDILGINTANAASDSNKSMQKEYDKYLKGFGNQEDDTNSFYKKQLSSLDPLYQGYEQQGREEMGKARQQDLNRLASLFSSYNTADSEQRMQQEERTMSDYGSKLSDLLQNLSLQKQKESSGIQSDQFGALNQISQAKQSAGLNVANLLQNARQQQFENSLNLSKLRQSGANSAYNSKKNVYGTAQDLASNWMSNQSDPYARSGGRESITRQLAAQYGGSPEQYMNYFPNGWEETFFQQPAAKGKNLVSIGDGHVMDKDTGDVFQAYE